MRKLLKLRNIEVRLTPESMQMYAKFYLFEHVGKQVLISGCSNLTQYDLFEEVAKEQIFKSITNTNLSNRVLLRDAYMDTKNRLGRIPNLSDFGQLDTLDPYVFLIIMEK